MDLAFVLGPLSAPIHESPQEAKGQRSMSRPFRDLLRQPRSHTLGVDPHKRQQQKRAQHSRLGFAVTTGFPAPGYRRAALFADPHMVKKTALTPL